jgi:hypothetical protein
MTSLLSWLAPIRIAKAWAGVIAHPRYPRSERDGWPALQDRLDQLRAQEGEANETANVAPGNAVTLGQLLERSGAAADELMPMRRLYSTHVPGKHRGGRTTLPRYDPWPEPIAGMLWPKATPRPVASNAN